MLRSRDVSKTNLSNSYTSVLIFGIGRGFLTNLFFTSQKLLRKHIAFFFFGIINDGDTHSDGCCCSKPPVYMISHLFDDGVFMNFWYWESLAMIW
jgi:hypothetical protein